MVIYHGAPGFYGILVSTLLVSPQPLSDADVAALGEQAERLDFTPVLTRDEAIDPRFARIAAPGGPDDALEGFDEDLSPPNDNRPFFFQMADEDTLFSRRLLQDNVVTRPVLVLAILAVTVFGLAALCITLPLLVARRRGRRALLQRDVVPFYTYFAGIGLGFLLIEIAQLQRLSIYLGHPTYGLSVSLFSILLFSGIGSMLTERFVGAGRRRSLVAPLMALLVVVAFFGWLTPRVVHGTDGATTPTRIAIAVGLMMPLGLVMGMPFAIGMRAAAARSGTPTAFLWGINGATSVCASVLAVVLALFFGISTAFLAGVLAYALALASMALIARSPRAAVGPVEEDPDLDVNEPAPVPVG